MHNSSTLSTKILPRNKDRTVLAIISFLFLGSFVGAVIGSGSVFLLVKTGVVLLFGIVLWLVLLGNTVTFGLVLRIFIVISLSQFLFQQLALCGGIQNTRIITVIPHAIAGVIYARFLVRPMLVYRKVVKVRFKRIWSVQEFLLGCLITLSLVQIFNPFIGISAGIRGFLMGPFWMGFYFVGRYALGKYDDQFAMSILKTIIIVIGLSSLYGIVGQVVTYPWQLAYLTGLDSSNLEAILTNRMGSTIGRPAVSGMAGMIGFLVTFSWLISRAKHRLLLQGLAALSLILTIASGSRSAMLGLIAGLSLIMLFKMWKTSSRILLIVIIVFTIGFLLLLSTQKKIPVYSISRLATISPQQLFSGDVLQDRNLAARFEHWSKIIPIILQHPLGQGAGSWHQASTFDRVQVGTVADNEYLALTGELGFPGLFLYLVFVGTLGRQCWRVLRSRKARREMRGTWAIITGSTLIGVLVMSIACHPLYTFPSTMLVWLLWGMGSRFMALSEKQNYVY